MNTGILTLILSSESITLEMKNIPAPNAMKHGNNTNKKSDVMSNFAFDMIIFPFSLENEILSRFSFDSNKKVLELLMNTRYNFRF